MGKADGKRRGDVLPPAMSTNRIQNGEAVFKNRLEGGVIADGKIRVVAVTAKQETIASKVIHDRAADGRDEIVVFVFGLADDIGEVIDHDDADDRRDRARIGDLAFVFGRVFEDEEMGVRKIFDIVVVAVDFDFDDVIKRGRLQFF